MNNRKIYFQLAQTFFRIWSAGCIWQTSCEYVEADLVLFVAENKPENEDLKIEASYLFFYFYYVFFLSLSFSSTPQESKSLRSRRRKVLRKQISWWMLKREERLSECTLTVPQYYLHLSLSLPPESLSGLPLLVAGGWGHHLQWEPLDHSPWWSAYVAFYDSPLP